MGFNFKKSNSNSNEEKLKEKISNLYSRTEISITEAPFNAIGDGLTDNTESIQKALLAAKYGQSVIIPYDDKGGLYKFNNVHVPTGIHLKGQGGKLFGGIITFSNSIAQTYNTILEKVWFKQCNFIMEQVKGDLHDHINNIIFDSCFIDGTDKNDSGITEGDAFKIKGKVFDIKWDKTNICNYVGDGISLIGNSAVDLSGTPYKANGVFMSISNSKIFNCSGSGIYSNGSSLDGTSIHLSNVLLDNCGIGLNLKNIRNNNAGEINVFGSNLRIELCNQAIRNDGGNIYINGIWSFGKNPSVEGKIIHNIKGYLNLVGRISATNSTDYAVYNNDKITNVVIDGLLGGGLFHNVSHYSIDDKQLTIINGKLSES